MVLDWEKGSDLKSQSITAEGQKNGFRLQTEKRNKVSKYRGRSPTDMVSEWELRRDLKSQSIAEEAQEKVLRVRT